MQRSPKVLKCSSWYYTTHNHSARRKIKRLYNKQIRRQIKKELINLNVE